MVAGDIIGLLLDATMGGFAIAGAFQEFSKGRPPEETEEESATEFVKEMISQLQGETEADAALTAWRAKHAT